MILGKCCPQLQMLCPSMAVGQRFRRGVPHLTGTPRAPAAGHDNCTEAARRMMRWYDGAWALPWQALVGYGALGSSQ